MSHTERVVVLVDMDCFYCQVEENLNPSIKGWPLAVVQYNAWRGGGIIAVNYAAREKGVTRHMRGDEAKKKCPEIELVQVPNVREKADLTKYRDAGKLVAKVLQRFTPLLERASVDEAYLDITVAVKQKMESAMKEIGLNDIKNTHVAGGETLSFIYNLYNSGLCLEGNLSLAFGAVIVEEIRSAVFTETGYTCSAGIAHNKILAKLACGLHKPNKQTLLPQDNVLEVFKNIPVQKIRSLGGKFGETLTEELGITNMSELLQFSEKELTKFYDAKTANWLYNIARGINYDPVTVRLLAKSIACCKKFPGKSALVEPESVEHWLSGLSLEVSERLDKDFDENNRKAKQLVVSFSQDTNKGEIAGSRTISLNSYNSDKITKDALEVIKKNCLKPTGNYCIKFLGLSAGKFEDHKNVNAITSFFKSSTLGKIDGNAEVSSENKPNINVLGENNTSTADDKSDCDSISNEFSNVNSSGTSSGRESDPSFFLNYLENRKCKSPVKRDFDTSRALEDFCDDSSRSSIPDVSEQGPSSVDENQELFFTCKDCNKKVLNSEYVSHTDYHFAIQMVKEESKLHRSDKPAQSKTSLGNKSNKRKISESNKNSLTKYLQPDLKNNPTDLVELCPQCNKLVESSEILNHMDYHAAKKLHMEINPVYSSTKVGDTAEVKKKQESKRNLKQNSKNTSIAQFFKPII